MKKLFTHSNDYTFEMISCMGVLSEAYMRNDSKKLLLSIPAAVFNSLHAVPSKTGQSIQSCIRT